MNLPEAILEAKRRYGPLGWAREFPDDMASIVRQVGALTSDSTLVIYGAGRSFEDAFLRAMRPGEQSLPALPGGEPIAESPQRLVFSGGIELRLPVRHAEAVLVALESIAPGSVSPEREAAIIRVRELVAGGLEAIDAAMVDGMVE